MKTVYRANFVFFYLLSLLFRVFRFISAGRIYRKSIGNCTIGLSIVKFISILFAFERKKNGKFVRCIVWMKKKAITLEINYVSTRDILSGLDFPYSLAWIILAIRKNTFEFLAPQKGIEACIAFTP